MTNRIIPTTRPGYKLTVRLEDCIPVPSPPLTVSFHTALSNEETEALKARGAAVIPGKKKDDALYTFGGDSVNKDLILTLMRHNKKSNPQSFTPVGSINLAAFHQFARIMGIITAFLRTQSYPAFSGEIDKEAEDGGQFDSIEGLVSGKRKATFGERKVKKARAEGEDDDAEMDEDDELDLAGMKDMVIGAGGDSIPKAKPSTPPELLCGGPSQIPTLPGLVFPYFHELLEPDLNYIADTVREYFLECLSDSREGIRGEWSRFKAAMGAVSRTKIGLVIQHICLGIRLAIMGQCRLFPIFNNSQYVGFSLHGWYFTVNIDARQYSPVAYSELIKVARTMDEHDVAVTAIILRLGKLKLDGKKPTKAQLLEGKKAAVTPGGLAEFIRKFSISDESEREEIEKHATKLAYSQRFLPFSAENIHKATDLLISGSFPPVESPLYTKSGVITSTDPTLHVFAQFGDQGFSFQTPGGKGIKIPKTIEDDTLFKPYVKGGKTITPKPTIVVAKRSLRLCVEDWAKTMSMKTIFSKETRDSNFRCIPFGGDRGKQFWYGLIERIGPVIVEDKEITADEIDLGGGEADGDLVDEYLEYLE